jgi:predicted nucleotidyltransferase
MASTTEQSRSARRALEGHICHALPHLGEAAADIARIVDTLARTFQPERIYVFGSQARRTSTWQSDVDLLVAVIVGDERAGSRAIPSGALTRRDEMSICRRESRPHH